MAEEQTEKESTTEIKVVGEAEELPKTIVRRVVKDKLSEISSSSSSAGEISILRDSLQAFSESARIFIHYLAATANDTCKGANRQIINAEDVFNALEEIEFSEFIGPLRASLEEFRQKNAVKKSAKAKDTNKNTKPKETTAQSKSGKKQREVEIDEDEENASNAKGTNKKSKRKEPTGQTDVQSDGDENNVSTSKGKSNKKAKKKEPTAQSGDRKKQPEVESDEDEEDAD